MGYWRRMGSCISQVCNVIFFNGHPDESISARSHRTKSVAEWYIDGIFGKGHCKKAYETDINHAKELLRS